MKKINSLFILILFNINFCVSQTNVKYWYEGLLETSDFKGPIKYQGTMAGAAITSNFELVKDSVSNKLYFVAFMRKDLSFINYEKVANSVEGTLKHEQLHFDIAELIARKANKLLFNKKSNSVKIEIKMEKELRKLQDKFDNETFHGNNESKNNYYTFYIEEELEKLDEFKFKERKQ